MMHIAFCTDTNYVMPAGVAVISICENNKEEQITFHFVITDEGSSEDEVEKKVQPLVETVEKYRKISKIYRIEKEKLSTFECKGANYISNTAFARIFLPDILPVEIKKILYLDCDIVCNGSIKELWNIELGEYAIGGVIDCNGTLAGFRKEIQTPLNIPYINSGVLLLDLERWRKEGYVKKISDCANEHKFAYLDQDTLNYFFRDQIKILPVKYNAQTLFILGGEMQWHVEFQYLDEIREAMKNPVIIHYLTMNKPWKTAYCPHRDKWDKYLKMSVWKDYERQPILTRFDRTEEFQELMSVYWNDGELFLKGIPSFVRFFKVAVKFKNKSKLIALMSHILKFSSFLLEKIYIWKTRKSNYES